MRRFNRHAFLGMDDDRADPRYFREADPRAGFAPPDGGLDHDPTFYKRRKAEGWDDTASLFPEGDGTYRAPAIDSGFPPAAPYTNPRPQPQRPGEQRTSYVGRGPPRVRSDGRVHEDVCQALEDDDEIDASDIEVLVSSGEVRLRGTLVGDRDDRYRVEDIVYEIPGVTDVINEIRVRRAEDTEEEARP